jgi:tRNA(Ile)-lysidine synthase
VSRQQVVSVEDSCERALDVILARVSVSDAVQSQAIAVAYSGGLDSAVLLHLALAYTRKRGIQLFVFHVHHGLSRNADNWLQHCERLWEGIFFGFDAV